jgi:hypothetical protein
MGSISNGITHALKETLSERGWRVAGGPESPDPFLSPSGGGWEGEGRGSFVPMWFVNRGNLIFEPGDFWSSQTQEAGRVESG